MYLSWIINIRQYLPLFVISVMSIGFISFLLITNYHSQTDLQQVNLERLITGAERRANVLSYFFSERIEDLGDMASRRAFSAFFENRYLGMSMQYGLWDSLQDIGKSFDKDLLKNQLMAQKIYSRVTFLEKNGEVLVSRPDSSQPMSRELLKLIAQEQKSVQKSDKYFTEKLGSLWNIIISKPYFLNGKYQGEIIAWIPIAPLYDYLIKVAGHLDKFFVVILREQGQPLSPPGSPQQGQGLADFAKLVDMAAGTPKQYEYRGVRMIAVRCPIQGTPFSVVMGATAAAVLGQTSPQQLLILMALLAAGILGSVALIMRINNRKRRELEQEIDERRLAEEALGTSEGRYRTLVDNIALGISLIGSDHKIIMANPAVGKMLQKPVSEFIGKECFREFEKRNEVCPHCPGTKAMATGKLAETETRGVRDDGSLFDVHLYAFPVFGPDGKPTGFIEVVEDITERTEAKDAVQRAEEELRLISRNIPAIVFKGYADGSVDLFDDRVEAMTGYPRAEFDSRQRKWTDVILAEDLVSAKEAFIKALKNTGSYVREYRLRTKTGETIWVHERSYIVRDAEGMIEYISGVFFDVTARKRGEEALRENEERFRGLFETSPDVVAQVDLNLNFLLVNQMAESFFGYEPAHQLIGKSFLDLVDPKDHPKVLEDAQTLLATGILRYAEYTLLRQDGTSFPGEVSAALTKDLAGNPKAFTGSIRDIAERKRVQERLEAERHRLFSLMEVLPAYIYLFDLDHSISFANRFFREHFGDPEGRPCYEIIQGRQEPCEPCPPSRVFESHQPYEWEWTTASGRTFQSFAYPFVDIDGSPMVLSMGLDITVRKQAEDILRNSYKNLRKTLGSTVTALAAAVEMRDPYTAGHQGHVSLLVSAIARELGMSEDQIDGIKVAGALHDIGKLQVPAEILSKPGKLSEIEFQMIKIHAEVGYTILKGIEFPWPVAQAVLQHHERLDGSGYPFGLSGPDIILEARILAVADVVEAMSSHRPYRPALGIDKALEEISQNRGIIYDPDAVDACVKLFTEKGFKFED